MPCASISPELRSANATPTILQVPSTGTSNPPRSVNPDKTVSVPGQSTSSTLPKPHSTGTSFTSSQMPVKGTSNRHPRVNPALTVTLVNPSLNQLSQSIDRVKDQHCGHRDSHAPRKSYLLAKQLDDKTFSRLWEDADLFSGVTATLWATQRCVLYRIMPNPQHEGICATFGMILVRLMLEMNLSVCNEDFCGFGSSRIHGNSTSKEPDYCFCPISRLVPGDTPAPSLVLEVGVSESYAQLVQDAHWWNANPPTRPGLVMLIYVKKSPVYRVDIEVWKETRRQSGHNTRNPSPSQLELSQHLYVEGNIVHGGPLRLDFGLLMRRPPNPPIEHDIVFTDHQVLVLARQTEL
ncbi:unnamed protein product [Penicillium salamii]|uniref:Uncharacterized protein n=1 Tax=Penicillium salamii TaxID=1612424 RepID=A0A9W4JJ94_9EURO|nr:unnamed protein product [Penicillium salamii]